MSKGLQSLHCCTTHVSAPHSFTAERPCLWLQVSNMLLQLPVGRSLLSSYPACSLLTDRRLCMQGLSAQRLPVVRVYMATPLGTFCADVTKALAEDRLQVCVFGRLEWNVGAQTGHKRCAGSRLLLK